MFDCSRVCMGKWSINIQFKCSFVLFLQIGLRFSRLHRKFRFSLSMLRKKKKSFFIDCVCKRENLCDETNCVPSGKNLIKLQKPFHIFRKQYPIDCFFHIGQSSFNCIGKKKSIRKGCCRLLIEIPCIMHMCLLHSEKCSL